LGETARRFPVTPFLYVDLMKTEFNHAANDSPRSGSSKKVTPVMWAAFVVAMVAVAIWFGLRV
jgi:hypothetical protein